MPAGGSWLVFNGEIYNHRELRAELEGLGYSFRSTSDTEVLLRAYQQWGTRCLERCNGMWAFALWDGHQQRLFCARDRFGEKQLYYHCTPEGVLWFASEIAPLRLATGGHEPVNHPLVWDFLVYGLADHTAATFFGGIAQLEPGTLLLFHPGNPPQITRYYRLKNATSNQFLEHESAAAALRGHLQDAVRLRLRSDVAVASFLSAGLDSASIVALADHILPSLNGDSPCRKLRTYTQSYAEGHPHDESPRVRSALAGFRRVEARFIPASRTGLADDLLDLVAAQEQPFHNLSILASYRLLRRIGDTDHIKVVLSGEAGDELLAGYLRVYLPVHLCGLLAARRWGEWLREASAWKLAGLKGTAKGLAARPGLASLEALRNPAVGVVQPEFLHAYAGRGRIWREQWRSLALDERLAADLARFNMPQLLRHLDRNAMRWSVEARLPFLDHRLVEFAVSLPAACKLYRGHSKYVLRQAMARDLPQEIAWNRRKLGFGMEEQHWLREALALLEPSARLREFIHLGKLERRIRRADSPHPGYWLPLSLGLWMQAAYPGRTETESCALR
jgi:asparagine synthase (glutamine-hydrolysing)